MDNFDKLIQQKLEQFDVPYNEAHWAEMEGRLDTIRIKKIKRNIFVSVGAVSLLVTSFYLYHTTNTYNNAIKFTKDNNALSKKEVAVTTTNPLPIKEKSIKFPKQNIILDNNINFYPEDLTKKGDHQDVTESKEKKSNKTSSSPTDINERSTNLPLKESPLSAEFIVSNSQVCMEDEVRFKAKEVNSPVSYLWNFGDGTTSTKQNPVHHYNESGQFDVSLTLIHQKTGAETEYTERSAITILPKPQADFNYIETSLKHDDNTLKYPYTTFSVKNANNENSYSWDFGNGEATSTSPNSQIIYNQGGGYNVLLMVKNSYGCYNSITKNITIQNSFNLYAPGAFTPNGDGENDEFIPKSLLEWDVQFEMFITDKTGKMVYHSSNKNEPWKGKLNNVGAILPTGIYLWKVITYDANGEAHQHVGMVNLLD